MRMIILEFTAKISGTGSDQNCNYIRYDLDLSQECLFLRLRFIELDRTIVLLLTC